MIRLENFIYRIKTFATNQRFTEFHLNSIFVLEPSKVRASLANLKEAMRSNMMDVHAIKFMTEDIQKRIQWKVHGVP